MNLIIRRLVGPALVLVLVLGGAVWYVINTYQDSSSGELEIQGDTQPWDPALALSAEERYFILRSPGRLDEVERRALRAKYGIAFIEYLPGFGYVVKPPSSAGVGVLSELDAHPDLSLHRIKPGNRKAAALSPARPLSKVDLRSLGSLDGEKLPVLVTFRQDVSVTAQQTALASVTSETPIRRVGTNDRPVWRVLLTADEIDALAKIDTVRWIEPVGPPPQNDLGDAVPAVGGGNTLPTGLDTLIGQVEPCAALPGHAGYAVDRITPDAAPPYELCSPVMAVLATGDDPADFDPLWPLWLDSDGDRIGDQCLWDGTSSPCNATVAATSVAGTSWHWVKLDTTGPPHFSRYVHISGVDNLTNGHFRLCTNLPEDILTGCTWGGATTAGTAASTNFRLKPVPVTGVPVNRESNTTLATGPPLFAHSPAAHAMHVAGILAGNGDGDTSNLGSVGMAREASVHGFLVGMDGTQALNAYNDLMDHDIYVVNNSWGIYHARDYPSPTYWLSQRYDSLASGRNTDGSPNAWDHRVLIVGSAGNKGLSGWRSTRIANSSKNSIAVANLDKNLNHVASSSRGPTLDDRLAPLISAVGEEVRSVFPDGYDTLGGTSMAAPLVAATAALVAEAQATACNTPADDMHPALVRGILVHTSDEFDAEGPDYQTGFGLLQADTALAYATGTRFQTHAITTGYVEYRIFVPPFNLASMSSGLEGGKLRVTLTWDDPPWPEMLQPSAQSGLLQNDLDLELLGPDGRRHLPWVLDPDSESSPAVKDDLPILAPVPVASRDHRNTVEQVEVDAPQSGTWRIRVRSNHPYGADVAAQSFALVSGAFGDGNCTALTPRVREIVIWLPNDSLMWYLFWLAVVVILVLLIMVWLELRSSAQPPSLWLSILLFALFVFLLALIALVLFYSMIGIEYGALLAVIVVIAIVLWWSPGP